MICTPRDTKLLHTLGRFGVLSTEQVAKVLFPNVALTTVRRRLRILENETLIYRVHGLENGGSAWVLTKKAAQQVGCAHPSRHFNRNSIVHDVALSEVRRALESIGLGENWVPEHVLKAQAFMNRARADREPPFVPDAIFSVRQKNETRVVALEVELTRKHGQRYRAIFSRYKKKKSLWAVWYLVSDDALGHTLENIWREVNDGKRNDLLMWSSLASLFKLPRDVRVRSEHFSYLLRELVTVRTALPPAPAESRGVIKNDTEPRGAVF